MRTVDRGHHLELGLASHRRSHQHQELSKPWSAHSRSSPLARLEPVDILIMRLQMGVRVGRQLHGTVRVNSSMRLGTPCERKQYHDPRRQRSQSAEQQKLPKTQTIGTRALTGRSSFLTLRPCGMVESEVFIHVITSLTGGRGSIRARRRRPRSERLCRPDAADRRCGCRPAGSGTH